MKALRFAFPVLASLSIVLGSCATPAPATEPPSQVATEQESTAIPTAEPTPYPDVWKFGTVQSMTGYGAYWGELQSDAQQLAVDVINESGELPFQLEMIVGDHKTDDPVAGLAAARQQIDIYHVPWINSSWVETTIAINPLAQENKVVEMNAGGIGLGLTDLPWLHNTRLGISQVMPYLVGYLGEDLGVKKLAMLWRNDGTGKGQRDIAVGVAEELGMEVVFNEPYEGGENDFRSLIAKIAASGADGFLGNGMYGEDMGYFIKQAREAGLDIPVAGPDYSPPLREIAGESSAGLIFGGDIWHPGIDNPFSKQFEEVYSERFGIPPENIDQFAANYYELVFVMRDALKYVIERGGDPWDGQQLEDAVNDIRFFPTLFMDPEKGKMELLPDGTAIKPLFIFSVNEDGTYDQVSVVERPEAWGE